jgi:amino acid transporter
VSYYELVFYLVGLILSLMFPVRAKAIKAVISMITLNKILYYSIAVYGVIIYFRDYKQHKEISPVKPLIGGLLFISILTIIDLVRMLIILLTFTCMHYSCRRRAIFENSLS